MRREEWLGWLFRRTEWRSEMRWLTQIFAPNHTHLFIFFFFSFYLFLSSPKKQKKENKKKKRVTNTRPPTKHPIFFVLLTATTTSEERRRLHTFSLLLLLLILRLPYRSKSFYHTQGSVQQQQQPAITNWRGAGRAREEKYFWGERICTSNTQNTRTRILWMFSLSLFLLG